MVVEACRGSWQVQFAFKEPFLLPPPSHSPGHGFNIVEEGMRVREDELGLDGFG